MNANQGDGTGISTLQGCKTKWQTTFVLLREELERSGHRTDFSMGSTKRWLSDLIG